MGDNHVPLAQVPAEFFKAYGKRLTYSSLWRMAVEGAIPVIRLNGRLYLDRSDLQLVADEMEKRQRRERTAA